MTVRSNHIFSVQMPETSCCTILPGPYEPWIPKEMDIHRIIQSFGLEGTFRGHLAQPLCSEQGYLQLDQVAQSPI